MNREVIEVTDAEMHKDGVSNFLALYQGDLFEGKEIIGVVRDDCRKITEVIIRNGCPE